MNDKRRTILPGCQHSPFSFTLFPPNPYKEKGQDMTSWYVERIEESEDYTED